MCGEGDSKGELWSDELGMMICEGSTGCVAGIVQ